MIRSIPIIAPSRFTLRFIYSVALMFCAFVVYLFLNSARSLSSEQANRQFFGMLVVVGVMTFFVGLITWAINRRSLTLSDSELTIRAGFYSRTVKRSSLRTQSGMVGSLFDQRSIAPRWRTNGIRVPGFQAGWFRLVNSEKALVLLTNPHVVTYLPTTEGFSLLISTPDLLRALSEPATFDAPPPVAPTSNR